MKLRAVVQTVTGITKHRSGAVVSGELVDLGELPHPTYLEIVEKDGAFYLERFTSSGQCITDTWHQSMEEAKDQALAEYRVNPEAWLLVADVE